MVNPDILELASELKAGGIAFALATVVRTVSVTAAKAGARALVRSDGIISDGWIGGGCARGAVIKAAKQSILSGKTQLVSIQPEDLLDEQGLQSGSQVDGVTFATNHCPSKGTMDIFIEPVLPKPEMVIFGGSPVAVALADLGQKMGYFCTVCVTEDQQAVFKNVDRMMVDYTPEPDSERQCFIVVSSQGKGDEAAVRQALKLPHEFASFVGSRAKAASLRLKFTDAPRQLARFDQIKVPAGLDIGAITPEEIALSILAELTAVRRQGQRVVFSNLNLQDAS